jgi:hypothetical protein
MPIPERELQQLYGSAAAAGNAALFIGAGLSLNAGFPSWNKLLDRPREEAEIPEDLQDLPLVAQYYVQGVPGGKDALESHILKEFSKIQVTSSPGHQWLAKLPVGDIWTTNYDCLIERSMAPISVVASDEDLRERGLQRRRVMKMHGSLTPNDPLQWRQPPVITRQDYEEYEARHPRLWAALRATYLTKSFLFLGFSFSDPNIEILLRLSRTLLQVGAPEHFTVLRRPSDPSECRLYELQVADLEKTGVAVCEIEDFAEIEPILQRLVRRTRSRLLFVSGSNANGSDIGECSWQLGHRLAALDVRVASLAGPAAMRLSYALGRVHLAEERYDPDRIHFNFRHSSSPPPAPSERIGTAIYTGLTKEQVREQVLSSCRAAVIIGGGTNTHEEVELAKSLGVPFVPLARSRGAAETIWRNTPIEMSGIALEGTREEELDWTLLNNENVDIATTAAARLVSRAMYLK